MRRAIDLLSGVDLKSLGPGLHHDGSGLYLQVTEGTGRSWLYRYRFSGRLRNMGLGSLYDVPLSQARRKAAKLRAIKSDGIDPIAQRDEQRAAELASLKTFKVVAEEYLELHKGSWKNEKHKAQWERTLKDFAYPKLGDKAVAKITREDVLDVLIERWTEIPETMSRVRGRVAAILDYSLAKGYRTAPNVALWQGPLKKSLSRLSRRRVKHHPSMPYAEVPAFMEKLSEQRGVAARCLHLTILCAVRTTEARHAKWSEFNLDKAEWIVPAERTKSKLEHRVPLPPRAVAVLRGLVGLHPEYVFTAQKGKPLSDNAMLKLLDDMGHGDVTVHGFRSSFRNWAGECTSFPSEVCELALAHVNDDKTKAAYLRTDFFEKRRQLMEAWARFCAGENEPMRLVASA
jgi:integrase